MLVRAPIAEPRHTSASTSQFNSLESLLLLCCSAYLPSASASKA